MKANSASYPTVLPEKSSQFEPIDEKGSSFGRFSDYLFFSFYSFLASGDFMFHKEILLFV